MATGVKLSEARMWLKKQAIWQIYLPKPKHIPHPSFIECQPNAVHQADLLYLPHDTVKKKTYKYALNVVDMASRYKESEPLVSKSAEEVSKAFQNIYKRGPLTWPNLLQVDPGKEFRGVVQTLFAKHEVKIRRGIVNNHKSQAIVERFNRTLAERLFGVQYAKEMLNPEQRCTEWVRILPQVVAAINSEPTRLTGRKPSEAIHLKTVQNKKAIEVVVDESAILGHDVLVRYLYANGELEGGNHRRATDPIWSVTTHTISSVMHQPNQPVLYYINDGPARSFVREELQVIPEDAELPPASKMS
jgi:hypothetical protein